MLSRAALLLVGLLAALSSLPSAYAMDMGHMDMGDGATASAYQMKMYFHFTRSDYLLFKDWLPTQSNVFAASCIFCVALGMLDRLLAAFRGALEARWAYQRLHAHISPLSDKLSYDGASASPEPALLDVLPRRRAVWAAPFSYTVDPMRALVQGVQAFVSFAAMLVVMTFNFWFVLSTCVGMALGTLLFGRFAVGSPDAASHC